jgi:hypothetical protein
MRWRPFTEVMAKLCGFVLLGLAVGLGFRCSP